MSYLNKNALVSKIFFEDLLYYISNKTNITLDGNEYPDVGKFGDVEFLGNFGEGFRVSQMQVEIINAEKLAYGGYLFDITKPWNNTLITIKECDPDNDTTWDDCNDYYKGVIKNFKTTNDRISFTIDNSDQKDDQLIPSILVESQSTDNEVSSDLASNAASGQKNVVVDDASGFSAGQKIMIKQTGNRESATIDSIAANTLTMVDNLVNSYTTANSAEVEYSDVRSYLRVSVGVGNDQIQVFYPELFSVGELIQIRDKSNSEYRRIKSIDLTNGYIVLDQGLATSYVSYDERLAIKAFTEASKEFKGQTLPLQIGNLYNEDAGKFAKGITINSKIGEQAVLFDYKEMSIFEDVGVWDNSQKRFYTALTENDVETDLSADATAGNNYVEVINPHIFNVDQSVTVSDDNNSEVVIIDQIWLYSPGVSTTIVFKTNLVNSYATADNAKCNSVVGEYSTNLTYNGIEFLINRTAELLNLMTATGDVEKLFLKTGHASYINWINEDTNKVSNNTEIMSPSIITIDKENMLVIEEPDTVNDTIWVERGYQSDKAAHDADSSIFQSAQFSSKNLLIFREKFDGASLANFYTDSEAGVTYLSDPDDYIRVTDNLGYPSQMIDGNTGTYFNNVQTLGFSGSGNEMWHSFDVKFPKIDTTYSVYASRSALKIESEVTSISASNDIRISLLLAQIDVGKYNDAPTTGNFGELAFLYFANRSNVGTLGSINCYTSFESDSNNGTVELTGYNILGVPYNINIPDLTTLNNRWKFFIVYSTSSGGTFTVDVDTKIYNLGIWMDFFVNFSEQPIMAPLQGRENTSDVNTITGGVAGILAENPVDALALVLTEELEFDTTDFTSNWSTVRTEYAALSPVPEVAFSFGISDTRKRGWEFCEWVASHFNLFIWKDYEGLIDIVNLYEIQNDPSAGNEIHKDDIRIVGTERKFNVQHTGTDLIYNDVVVRYNRNNSTDQYQSTYRVPDDYTLIESGVTVQEARDTYYNGRLRTLEIESPFIYNLDDAERKAKWAINEYAEVHLYVTVNLPYNHYSDVNGLSAQYRLGDIMYLTGRIDGIDYSSNNKFSIRNVKFVNQGKEIVLEMRSNEPISEFTSLVIPNENVVQDVFDSSETNWQDTFDNTNENIQDIMRV